MRFSNERTHINKLHRVCRTNVIAIVHQPLQADSLRFFLSVMTINDRIFEFRSMLGMAFKSAHQKRRTRLVPVQSQVNFRGTPFAAAIPGDGVVEQVFTTGISSFL